jgi:YVTN family beta-propeller protein
VWNTATVTNGTYTLTARPAMPPHHHHHLVGERHRGQHSGAHHHADRGGHLSGLRGRQGNRVYVANQGSNTVSVIDTTTDQVIKRLRSGRTRHVAASPATNRVHVANHDTVSVIDTTTNQVTATIPIPDLCDGPGGCYGSAAQLTDVAVSNDGSHVYAVRWYTTDDGAPSAISVIDAATNTVTSTQMEAQLNDVDVTPDGTRLYGAEGDYHWVDIFDANGNSTGAIPVTAPGTGSPYVLSVAISPDGKRTYAVVNPNLFSTNSQAVSVSVLDTDPASATYNTQIATITVPAARRTSRSAPTAPEPMSPSPTARPSR